jgi:hypothetical protein
MVLRMLRKVESRGAIDPPSGFGSTSPRFSYAMAEGLCMVDPPASIGKALEPIAKKGKQPAVRTIKDAREVLRAMEEDDLCSACPSSHRASRPDGRSPGGGPRREMGRV